MNNRPQSVSQGEMRVWVTGTECRRVAVRDDYDRLILEAIASGNRLTQRSLARSMGVALGLTNLLIRRLVAKGYVRVSRAGTRHVRYLMTSAGREALRNATRASFDNTVRLYTETREQIRSTLDLVSHRCAADASGRKTVVFYGAGDVAEIAFVSLQTTDLQLIGVVDDRRRGRFFDRTILPSTALRADGLDGQPYGQIVVTTVRHAEPIRQRLIELDIPSSRVSFLLPHERSNPHV
jgi:DNA-binding MarR family transcriptional regulator